MTERGRVTLSDHTFKVFDLIDGTLQKETVTNFSAYVAKLRALLGIELNVEETARLEERFAALKVREA